MTTIEYTDELPYVMDTKACLQNLENVTSEIKKNKDIVISFQIKVYRK